MSQLLTYADVCEPVEGTEKVKCKCCGKICKNSNGFGSHFVFCKEVTMEKEDRKKLLKRAHTFRSNHSVGRPVVVAKHRKTDTYKATHAKSNAKWAKKETSVASIARYAQTPAGRLAAKKARETYSKKNPQVFEFLKARGKELNILKHRLSEPLRQNKSFLPNLFALQYSLDGTGGIYDDLRASQLVDAIEHDFFDGPSTSNLLERVDSFFAKSDSSAHNYVYFLCDPLLWTENTAFSDFLDSIFYIGRGVGSRFANHCHDVQILLNGNYDINEEKMPKESKIKEIWEKSGSVNAVLLNLNKFAEKTDFVEFCCTLAIGLEQLTNKKFDGASSTPMEFTIDDVCNVAVDYLGLAYKQLKHHAKLYRDRDYGKKINYNSLA